MSIMLWWCISAFLLYCSVLLKWERFIQMRMTHPEPVTNDDDFELLLSRSNFFQILFFVYLEVLCCNFYKSTWIEKKHRVKSPAQTENDPFCFFPSTKIEGHLQGGWGRMGLWKKNSHLDRAPLYITLLSMQWPPNNGTQKDTLLKVSFSCPLTWCGHVWVYYKVCS